jgi:virulence factor Mce-like protein
VTRILIAVGFAISCFALALFLWLAFGGAIPLKPEGYRFKVPFTEATQLAVESDVRISGVSVGKVKQVELSDSGRAEATIEVDAPYAPIPENTRATLRQKTLLGETYVELTPGDRDGPTLPEGDALPQANVADSVQLDEIFRTFDEPTRAAFQAWMQGQAASLRGRGEDLNIAIASLVPFAEQADKLLRQLDSQDLAVQKFVRDGGEVFEALSERSGQLRGLIDNAATVFATTAARDQELEDTFRVFPTFLRESRETLDRLERFAVDTDPVVQALQPTAEELQPTLLEAQRLSPQLEDLFKALPRTIRAAPAGFGATRKLLDDNLPPLLEAFDPWLADFNSILEVVRMYRREVTSFLANVAALSNGVFFDPELNEAFHYVRTEAPLAPEAVASYPQRLGITRTNPYLKPGGYLDVKTFMRSFETRQCGGGINAALDPTTPSNPDFQARVHADDVPAESQAFFDRLKRFAFVDQLSTTAIAAPGCEKQAPFDSIGVSPEQSDYLHVRQLP